jgi:hypothetical protein
MFKKVSLTLLITILIINLLGCGASVPKNFSELDKDEQEAIVESFAEKAVISNLKAPSTAKVKVLSFDSLDDNKYKVSGFVDSENSFGAKIRSDFNVEFKISEEYDKKNNRYKCSVTSVQIK